MHQKRDIIVQKFEEKPRDRWRSIKAVIWKNIVTKKRMKCGLVADLIIAVIIMVELFVAGHFLS